MKVLIKGSQTEKRLDLLLSLTGIDSPNKIEALNMHLVAGWDAGISARTNVVDVGNFSRCLATLEEVAQTVEQIKELDWSHL